MKTIVIASFAGGVGKTTTAHSLATAMCEYGQKTLLIDADPNATLTFLCGVENPRFTLLEVLNGSSLQRSVVSTGERFSLLPGSARLNEISEFTSLPEGEDFDLSVVDTASSLNPLAVSLMKVAELIVVPVSDSISSIRAALHIRDFVGLENVNKIRILDCGMNIERKAQLSSDFEVLETVIRRGEEIRVNELNKVSVLTSAPNSAIASDYREIGYSILEELGMI